MIERGKKEKKIINVTACNQYVLVIIYKKKAIICFSLLNMHHDHKIDSNKRLKRTRSPQRGKTLKVKQMNYPSN